MRLVWHGHSCFEIDDGDVTVVIDPHDGRSLGIKPPSASADLVLMTHDHYDHSAFRVIRGIHDDFLAVDGRFSSRGLTIDGFPTFHDLECGGKFGSNTMYRFTIDGISVCHCGDIGAMPSDEILDELQGTDILLVPVGEINTLCIEALNEMISRISPKVVIPMHYHVCGLSLPLRNLDRFMDSFSGNVDYVGGEMDISHDELPQRTELWIFSR